MEHLKKTKIGWFRHKLAAWAEQHLRDFPWRRMSDPYAVFVAEFLLQKTNASTVVPVYEVFLARYPTLEALGAAPVEEVARVLQPLGLFFRASRLHQSVQVILDEYKGKIPDTEGQLLALPGVGKYTARAICASTFGQRLAQRDRRLPAEGDPPSAPDSPYSIPTLPAS